MIDQDVFEKLLEIGGPQLARRVIDLFFEHTPSKIESLRLGLSSQELKTIERAAHSIKSSAANLGLENLRQVASQLEQAANQGQLESCIELVPKLEAACTRAETLLKDKQKELESA